jgi:citrate lyase beta subunit
MERHDPTRFLGVRTIFETPILDDRKWAKAQTLSCDALFLDLEDSAAPDRKGEALERALAALAERDRFGKPLVARSNPLDSPTGRDEIAALARAGVEVMTYPKLRDGDELREVVAALNENGADPDLLAIVETMDAVTHVDEILDVPQVVGVLFGPGDLSVDMGIRVHGADGRVVREPFLYARSRVVLAAARRGLARYDIAFVEDLRNLDDVRAEAEYSKAIGFTGMTTFYPSHIDVIHEVFAPTATAVDHARDVIAAYEQALAAGNAAVSVNGRGLVVHDYENAQRVIAMVGLSQDA